MPKQRKFHIDKRAAQIAATQGDDDDLLTTKETADWLNVSTVWLEIGRSHGYGPPFQKLAERTVRYHRGRVRKWLAERTHTHTKEYVTTNNKVA